jgi:hypothetical protein
VFDAGFLVELTSNPVKWLCNWFNNSGLVPKNSLAKSECELEISSIYLLVVFKKLDIPIQVLVCYSP